MQKQLAFCALALLLAASARGGTEPPAPVVRPAADDVFAKGSREFQNVTGAFFYFDTTQNRRPSIDYVLDSVRLGVMLNDPWRLGPLTGNVERLGEVFVGPVVEGPGSVLAGGTLIWRYNFVQPRARLIPYVQVGGGAVYTNIPEKESGGLISLPVEFNLQAGAGTRLLLNDRWSIVIEGGYRHISNAEIKTPNFGIDSVGGNVGFGFFF